MNNPNGSGYHVYIVRLWRTESPNAAWQASLENPRTGVRIGFENLERMFAFLIEQTEREMNIKLEESK